jgi:hypothetical protein
VVAQARHHTNPTIPIHIITIPAGSGTTSALASSKYARSPSLKPPGPLL